jgi:hypothetical protein
MKKTLLIPVSILLISAAAHADNFTTRDGDTYTNAVVKRVEPDGIVISDVDGIRKLKFTNLSPEIQTKYGFDPGKAAQFSTALSASAITAQQEMVKAQNAELAAKITTQPSSVAAASSVTQPVVHPHKGVDTFDSHIHGCGGKYRVLSCDDSGLTCRHSESYSTSQVRGAGHYNTQTSDTEIVHIPYYHLPPEVRAACGLPPPSISDPM